MEARGGGTEKARVPPAPASGQGPVGGGGMGRDPHPGRLPCVPHGTSPPGGRGGSPCSLALPRRREAHPHPTREGRGVPGRRPKAGFCANPRTGPRPAHRRNRGHRNPLLDSSKADMESLRAHLQATWGQPSRKGPTRGNWSAWGGKEVTCFTTKSFKTSLHGFKSLLSAHLR